MKCPNCGTEINQGTPLSVYGIIIPIAELNKIESGKFNILHEIHEKKYRYDVLVDTTESLVVSRVCAGCGFISLFVSKTIRESH
jgi:hypothetical protein